MPLLFSLLMGIFAAAIPTFAGEDSVTLTVLQTTDLHGSPQFANLAQIIKQERQNDPDLLLIDCGDTTVRGSFEASLDGGAFMVAMLNQLKYDVWVPGNHEFRVGYDLLVRNTRAFKGTVLAANLELMKQDGDKDGLSGKMLNPEPSFASWKMFQRKGLKIAVIGIISPYYDRWFNYPVYDRTRLLSPKEVLAKLMPEIRKQKPDIVILAAHIDYKTGVQIKTDVEEYVRFHEVLAEYPEICLMMMGHTHGAEPGKKLIHEKSSSSVHLVQPETHARSLAKIQICYQKGSGKVTDISSELLKSKNVPPVTDLPEEWEQVQKLARAATEKKLICFPAEWVHLDPKQKAPEVPWVRMYGEAMREAVGADASMPPSGGGTIRKQYFTALDLYHMVRNEYTISKLTFTPEQLKKLLEALPKLKPLIYGIDVNNLPDRNITIAFDAYDVTGCDGAYDALRIIAGKVPALHSTRNMREVMTQYLMKHYPAKTQDPENTK